MEHTTFYEPIQTYTDAIGVHRIFRFPNGYGASLVSFAVRGTLIGKAEIAVIGFKPDGNWYIVDDLVKNDITPQNIMQVLAEIAELPIR